MQADDSAFRTTLAVPGSLEEIASWHEEHMDPIADNTASLPCGELIIEEDIRSFKIKAEVIDFVQVIAQAIAESFLILDFCSVRYSCIMATTVFNGKRPIQENMVM